jgi:polar amino acid transport system substrate-binding protein
MVALLAVSTGAADAAPSLVIGRVNSLSPLADISARIVREAFERAGLTVEFRPLPLIRSIEMANDGEIDGDLMRIETVAAAYPNLMMVPIAINRVDLAIYGIAPRISGLTRSEIRLMRVGVRRGNFVVARHSAGLSTIEAQTPEATFDMVRSGRVGVAIATHVDTEAHIADGSVSGVQAWPCVWASELLSLLLNRRHRDQVPRIEGALRQMSREGLIDRYYVEELRSRRIVPLRPEAEVVGR